jgi:hypothetical protein
MFISCKYNCFQDGNCHIAFTNNYANSHFQGQARIFGLWDRSLDGNNNNIYLTAIGMSPGGSGYLTCIQI